MHITCVIHLIRKFNQDLRQTSQYSVVLGQSMRAKSLKLFEEIALRQQATSLILMGRLEDAEAVQRLAIERGVATNTERYAAGWHTRNAMLRLYQGDIDAAIGHVAQAKINSMPGAIWFFALIPILFLDTVRQRSLACV